MENPPKVIVINFNWSWHDFCGRESLVVWNQKHRDFDICFQFVAFQIPILCLIAITSSYYLGALYNHVNRIKRDLWILRIRYLTTLCLSGLPIIRTYMEENMFPGELQPVDYLMSAIQSCAWFMHCCYLVALTNRVGPSIRGHVFLGGVWAVSYILTWINLHTNYLIMTDPDTNMYASGVPYKFSVISVILQTIYLFTLFPSGSFVQHLHRFESIHSQSGEHSPLFGHYSGFREDMEEHYLGVAMEGWGNLSRLMFSWVNPLIQKGVAGQLQTSDELYVLPLELTPSFLYNKLSSALKISHRSGNVEQVTILKALHKCFWKEFYGIGILKLIADMSGFCGPLILNLLVKFIEDKNEPIQYGYGYALGLSISALIGALCNSHYNFLISKVGLKIKGALISLIYRKILSTNSANTSHLNSGEITNYISTDMDRIVNSCASFHAFWSIPVQLIVTLILLYLQVKLSFLSGVAFSAVLIALNRILAKKIGQLSEKTMAYKDDRLLMMGEIFRGIKAIKYYVWENIFFNKIQDIRKDEMKYLSKRKYLDALCVYFWATTPVMISLLTFSTYSLTGNQLTASTVFTTIALLNKLISLLNVEKSLKETHAFPWVLNVLTDLFEAWVSLKRIERLLKISDCELYKYYDRLLDFPEHGDPNVPPESLIITNGSFKWSDGNFILNNININIKEGELIAVIGSVGSGKSSLISAILSEIEKTSGSVSVMKYEEGFGYVGQTPWLQKGTIQENILFGEPFVKGKYWTALKACKLMEDIENFPGKDNALIGESGCTLSGGQKARIALARAVYQDKSIYLLDDVLSAVDPEVARHIFHECICGVLKNKTRLLFTHESRFLINADHIVEIQDGKILQQGRPSVVLKKYNEYVLNKELETEDLPESESTVDQFDPAKADDPEEKAHGSLDWSVVRLYIMSAGTCLWPLILASLILMQTSRNGVDYWLSFWVSQTNYTYPSELPFANSTSKYLIIYASIAGLNSIFTLFRAFLFAYGGLNAAKKLQKRLLQKVINAKMLFFETNSSGRILNRFSSDIYTIDDSLPFIFNILVASFFGLLGTLFMTLYGLPWLFLIFAPLIPIYHNYQSNYRLTSRELERISSTTMSPLYGHFNETLQGAVTIRAFRANSKFIRDNSTWLEANIQAQLCSSAASQWLGLRLQLIGVAMISGVGILATIQHHLDFAEPGLIGLVISYALTLTSWIGGLVNSVTETEREMISVERVSQYLNNDYEGLTGEDKSSSTLSVRYDWPDLGVIIFHNVSFRYRDHLPYSLRKVNFVTRPREKIGVVGRTGAGKSSLISALFRMCELQEGEISIDWKNTKLISLNELRSRMCIIPQDPFIFKGSVRDNLDPNLNHSDNELNDVLYKTRMLNVVQETGGLDKIITKESFSSGQAQLLCLARAILKKSKIICIDEATANVDEETDSLIQETIRVSFRLSTVITIAHRVRTIMDCDRVLVMSDGQVLEFDTPQNLLSDTNSHFYHLANPM